MGTCCSKKHLTKRKAFHQELGAPLLESLAPQLGKNARVIKVRLLAMKKVPGMVLGTTSNPFLQMRLMPEDEIGGPQHQSSSIIPGTVNPQWEPPERFQFVVSDVRKARILLSVFHYDEARPKENFPIGDSVVKLEALKLTDEPTQFQFKLVNPSDGQTQGEVVLMLSEEKPSEAQKQIHETVYEYQEWSVLSDWQPMATPGRWSTADGKTFKDDLEQVGMVIPEGWEMENTWSIMGTQLDPDGWQYTTRLDSAYWYPKNDSALFVLRRRTWSRDLRKAAKGSKKMFGSSKTSSERASLGAGSSK